MSCIIYKFVKKSGEYNYAYVVLIINNDIYANPGIIFAESLRKVGCLSDIIAMVDDKITDEVIILLKNFFNKIIKIKSIKINHYDPIQKVILSKINVFKLINYKKIFLIDVDTIIFTNLDNFFLDSGKNKNDFHNIYMCDIKNYGFIMISPSNEIYNKCIKLISQYNKNPPDDFEKPFEYILSKIYDPSNIIKLDIKISYDQYSNVDCIQYRKDKPFLMTSEFTIEQRQRLDHFKIWFSYLMNIMNKYPELKDYKCLNESISISKYFLASLSKFILEFIKSTRNKKMINVKNIYGTNNYDNLDYYHLDLSREYSNKYIKYDTNTYNIKSFLKYIDLNFEKKRFTNYYKYTSIKILIKELEKSNDDLLYIFLNNYIKIYKNTIITMEIKYEIKQNNDTIKDLKNNLIYKKQFNLKNITLKNIIFNLHQNFTYEQRIEIIKNKINKPEYNLTISIYETIIPIIDHDQNHNLDLFIFYEQSSKIRLSSIFFNPNTINYYESELNESSSFNIFKSNSETNILTCDKIIKMMYLQTIKKFIYSIYTGDEINNLGLCIENYNKMILIDNNNHSIMKIKKINKNKLFFITIFFSNKSQYKKIMQIKNVNHNIIYDINRYWEFEGIKIVKKFE